MAQDLLRRGRSLQHRRRALSPLEREVLEPEHLETQELSLLSHAVGDHLPVEDPLRLEALRRRRRLLAG